MSNKLVATLVGAVTVACLCIWTACAAQHAGVQVQYPCYTAYEMGGDNTITQGWDHWYANASTDYPARPNGVFRRVWVYSIANNKGNCVVELMLNDELMARYFFGPGGGISEYIYCDSLYVIKTIAADTISWGMCP